VICTCRVSTSSSIQVESSDSGMEQTIYEKLESEAAEKHVYRKPVVRGGRLEGLKRNPNFQSNTWPPMWPQGPSH
jgi:hypothetical protein